MKKRRIIIDSEAPSTEEIAKGKNWEHVLKSSSAAMGFWSSTLFKLLISGSGILVIGTLSYVKWQSNQEPETTTISTSQSVNSEQISSSSSQTAQATNSTPQILVEKIAPPIPEKKIAYETFSFNNQLGDTLISQNGSVIIVPPNTLVNKNKQLISGRVSLKFREIHSQEDLYLSGYPLHYSSKKKMLHSMESGGVFEIQPADNNSDFQQEIEIRLVASSAKETFDLHHLNQEEYNWEYTRKAKNVSATFPIAAVKAPPLTQAPLPPAILNEDKFILELEPDYLRFPELLVYEGVKFELLTINDAVKDQFYELTWDSIRLHSTPTIGEYELRLFYNQVKLSVPVKAGLIGKDLERAQLQYQKDSIAYVHQLKTAEKRILEQNSSWKSTANQRTKSSKFRFRKKSTISQPGIFGFLRKIPLEKTKELTFTDQKLAIDNIKRVYWTQPSHNALFYDAPGKIRLNSQEISMMWVKTMDGKTGIVPNRELEKISQSDGSCQLEIILFDDNLSYNEIKRLTLDQL